MHVMVSHLIFRETLIILMSLLSEDLCLRARILPSLLAEISCHNPIIGNTMPQCQVLLSPI
jgi:hypothetical protein